MILHPLPAAGLLGSTPGAHADSGDGGLSFGEQGPSAACLYGPQVTQASCSKLLILLSAPPPLQKGPGLKWGCGWGRLEGMAAREMARGRGRWGEGGEGPVLALPNQPVVWDQEGRRLPQPSPSNP